MLGYSKYPYHFSIGVVAVWRHQNQRLVALGHHFDGQVRLPSETPYADESLHNTIKRLGEEELGAILKPVHFLGVAKQPFFRPIDAEKEYFKDPNAINPNNPCTATLPDGRKATIIEKSVAFFLTDVVDFIAPPALKDNKYVTYGKTMVVYKDPITNTEVERAEVKVVWLPFNQALVELVEAQRAEYKILRRAYKLCREYN